MPGRYTPFTGAMGSLLPTIPFESLSKANLEVHEISEERYEFHKKTDSLMPTQMPLMGPFLNLRINQGPNNHSGWLDTESSSDWFQPYYRKTPKQGTAEAIFEDFLADIKYTANILKTEKLSYKRNANESEPIVNKNAEMIEKSPIAINYVLSSHFEKPNWSCYVNEFDEGRDSQQKDYVLNKHEKVEDPYACRDIGFNEADVLSDDYNYVWSLYMIKSADSSNKANCCSYPFLPKMCIKEAEEVYKTGGLAEVLRIIIERINILHFDPAKERIKLLKPEEKWEVEMVGNAFTIDFSEKMFEMLRPQPFLLKSLFHDDDRGLKSQSFLGFLENRKLEELRLLYPKLNLPDRVFIPYERIFQMDPATILNQHHYNLYIQTVTECVHELNKQRKEVEDYLLYKQQLATEWTSNRANATKSDKPQTKEEKKAAKKFALKMSKQSMKAALKAKLDPEMQARKERMENYEPAAITSYYNKVDKQGDDAARVENERFFAASIFATVQPQHQSQMHRTTGVLPRLQRRLAINSTTISSSHQNQTNTDTNASKTPPLQSQSSGSGSANNESATTQSSRKKVTKRPRQTPINEEESERTTQSMDQARSNKIKQRTQTPGRNKSEIKAILQELSGSKFYGKIRKSRSVLAIWGSATDLSEVCDEMEDFVKSFHEKPLEDRKDRNALNVWEAMKAEIDIFYGDWRNQLQQDKDDNYRRAKEVLSAAGENVSYQMEEDGSDFNEKFIFKPYHHDIFDFDKKKNSKKKKFAETTM